MRVDAQTKERTEQRIRHAARKLFIQNGLELTTTRDVAKAAGIAVGTLFNYFPTKEALGVALIADALAAGESAYRDMLRGDESLAEDLFAFIISGFRQLEEERRYAADVLEFACRPTPPTRAGAEAFQLQEQHAAVLGEILSRHGVSEPAAMHLHLYWSLYLGMVRFWSNDRSEHLVETLALVDQATRLFASAVKPVPIQQEA